MTLTSAQLNSINQYFHLFRIFPKNPKCLLSSLFPTMEVFGIDMVILIFLFVFIVAAVGAASLWHQKRSSAATEDAFAKAMGLDDGGSVTEALEPSDYYLFELPEGKSDFCYKARGTSEHGGEQCALTGGGVRATRTATRCWWAASSARPR